MKYPIRFVPPATPEGDFLVLDADGRRVHDNQEFYPWSDLTEEEWQMVVEDLNNYHDLRTS